MTLRLTTAEGNVHQLDLLALARRSDYLVSHSINLLRVYTSFLVAKNLFYGCQNMYYVPMYILIKSKVFLF